VNKRTDSRFPLLPYRMLAKRWRWPTLLLIPAGLALYWVFPDVPNANPRLAPLGLVISLVGLLLFVYTLLMRRAHISCHQYLRQLRRVDRRWSGMNTAQSRDLVIDVAQ
jgi:hypothetical protein